MHISVALGSIAIVGVVIALYCVCCHRRLCKLENRRHKKMDILKSLVTFRVRSSSRSSSDGSSRGPCTSVAYNRESMPLNQIHVVDNPHYFMKPGAARKFILLYHYPKKCIAKPQQ